MAKEESLMIDDGESLILEKSHQLPQDNNSSGEREGVNRGIMSLGDDNKFVELRKLVYDEIEIMLKERKKTFEGMLCRLEEVNEVLEAEKRGILKKSKELEKNEDKKSKEVKGDSEVISINQKKKIPIFDNRNLLFSGNYRSTGKACQILMKSGSFLCSKLRSRDYKNIKLCVRKNSQEKMEGNKKNNTDNESKSEKSSKKNSISLRNNKIHFSK
uniref:Uncharacterized protein n=1 Tax=Strongyloides venezuelensis TaxID=75913 RepID=A0A0K0EW25_STRVS